MLCYECEVWGFSKNKEIKRNHLKVCKSLLNIKNTTCTMSVYGELSSNWAFSVKHTNLVYECLLRPVVMRALCCFICLFLYGPLCPGALKLDMSTLFTTLFL